MSTLLNFVNRVSDEDAIYLYNRADEDSADKSKDSTETSETVFSSASRRLVLFISHNSYLVTFGYINDALVWFSNTPVSDTLLTRRIFDCVKVGAFYRKVEPETVLNLVGMTQRDLYGMCRTDVISLENDHPLFSGSIVSQPPQNNQPALTGVEFANLIAVMPQRFKSMIGNIGTDDDILAELEKDYKRLVALSHAEPVDAENNSRYTGNNYCYKEALAIRDKWSKAECLKMADRAAIRTLYCDICSHPFVTHKQAVSDMLHV